MRRLALLAVGVGPPSETVPLGAASVAAALRRAFPKELTITIIEADPAEDAGTIASRVLASGAEALGLSVYAWNRELMMTVARSCRSAKGPSLIFAGGPEATADPWSLFEDAPLDFVVVGEGEITTVEALRFALVETTSCHEAIEALGLGHPAIPGLALPGRKDSFARRSGAAVEGLASPWLEGLLSPVGRDEVVWELSRGCAFHCAYCYEGRGEGGVRALPRARIEAELDYFVHSGVRRLFVLDPTFNWKRDRALDLLGLFASRGKGIVWKFEVRAELLDRGLARAFARLDASLQIGLQSARPEVLAKVGRPGFAATRFAEKIALLDAEGLTWGLDLIYGLPGDDLAGFRRSVDYALGLQPNHLDIFPLALLPGTELASRAVELGLIAEARAPHLVLETPGFSIEDMAVASRLAGACDLFYSRGRAVPWFLRALRPLSTKPAAFLSRFAEWLRSQGSGKDVEELQLSFLEAEYQARGVDRIFPLVRDTIRLEGAWAGALADGKTTKLALSYEPDLLLYPPSPDLRELAARIAKRPSRVRIVPGPRGPKLTILKN